MSNLHLHRRAMLLVIFLLAACPMATFAQQTSSPLTYDLSIFVDSANDALQRQVADALGARLQARGAVSNKTPDWTFLVRALPVKDGSDKVVFSVVTLHRLPEEAIRLGTEAQVLYADVPAQQRAVLPSEGKAIRQQLSEEFLRRFGTVVAHDIVVVGRSDLMVGVEEIVGRFYERYSEW